MVIARGTTRAKAATRVIVKESLLKGLVAVLSVVLCGIQYWTFFGSPLTASPFEHAPIQPDPEHAAMESIAPTPTPIRKTCIVIGMISRSTETQLRQWHREIFRKHGNSHSFSDMVDIHLLFGMAYSPLYYQLQLWEMSKQDDLAMFEIEETESCGWNNRCLIRNEIPLYRKMLPLCDGDYESAYFVKTDSDVVHNYEMIARVFMDLPNKSVYLGRLIPNMPNMRVGRAITESSLDFLPVFAQGAFQGFSKDLLSKVLESENVATVLKEEAKYYYPDSDRSLGIELRRANIPVEHPVFMKGSTYLCPAESFDCKNHWNSISFHAGYGFSGAGENKTETKLGLLKSIHEAQLKCLRPATYDKDDHYIILDDDILRNGNASYWYSRGCSTLGQDALRKLHDADAWTKELKQNERPKNWACADKLYSKSKQKTKILGSPYENFLFNENDDELSNALAKKMEQNGSDGVGFESRMHYITEGYRSPHLHYYCPHQCQANGNLPKCNCDMEAVYLENYPDAASAVAKGKYQNGLEHFMKKGYNKRRSWSCYPKHASVTTDSKEGCSGVFRDFAKAAKHKMLEWPIGGSEDFQITSPTCNAAVLVNDQDDSMVEFVLKNHRRYLGPYWIFYLIGPKETADVWREKYSGPMIEIVDIPESLGVNLSDYPHGYNTLLTSDFLWKEVVACENILISQTDALLFRHGIEDFFIYDYVGSPIYPESHPSLDWRLLSAFGDASGGNGGFSIRKRSAMLQALEECELPRSGFAEDVWASACMVLLDRPMPDTRMANRFSVGTKCELDVPLGAHKLWLNCGTATCENVIVSSRFHRDLYGEEPFDRNCREGEFLYLQQNPDVAAAVARGMYASGWERYDNFGRFDKKKWGWRCLTRTASIA